MNGFCFYHVLHVLTIPTTKIYLFIRLWELSQMLRNVAALTDQFVVEVPCQSQRSSRVWHFLKVIR
jgi:hypothetical protein